MKSCCQIYYAHWTADWAENESASSGKTRAYADDPEMWMLLAPNSIEHADSALPKPKPNEPNRWSLLNSKSGNLDIHFRGWNDFEPERVWWNHTAGCSGVRRSSESRPMCYQISIRQMKDWHSAALREWLENLAASTRPNNRPNRGSPVVPQSCTTGTSQNHP